MITKLRALCEEWRHGAEAALYMGERSREDGHLPASKFRDGQYSTWMSCASDLSRVLDESGWQPIASAPKDGTYLLGYGPHDRDGSYIDTIHWYIDRWTIQWMDGYGAPTHWRSLPEPPDPTP